MKKTRALLSILASLAFGASFAAAQSSGLVPVGGEIRVNTTTAEDQSDPDVAMDDAGHFVVVWSGGPFLGNREIFAQRYDASGTPLGSEFQVNTFTGTAQINPRVGMDADGDFVVVWASQGQFPPAGFSIVGQRFDKTGARLGGEFHISAGLTALFPDVAMGANGDFLVVWPGRPLNSSAFSLYARLYDSAGTPQTSSTVIDALSPLALDYPGVTATPGGDWIVVWTAFVPATGDTDILAQRLGAAGNLVGSKAFVQEALNGSRQGPHVAASSGRIAVSWEDFTGDGSARARLFDDGFSPLTGELGPSTLPLKPTQESAVAMDGAGRFVTAWVELGLDGDPTRDGSEASILARAFDAAGNPLGSDFVVNTTAAGFQAMPALAMSPAGHLVATWVGPDASFQNDVFAQVYATVLTPEEQIAATIDEIEALIAEGALTSNRANPLIQKLEGAAAKVDAGNVGAACNQLGAFINQVNAYIGNGTLTAAQGQELIDSTNAIRATLGC